jgi:hypothetical protein
MLAKGFDFDTVKEITGLSDPELTPLIRPH